MTKIAYNGCYGGFSLSKEGVLLGRKLSGDPKWGGVCLKGDVWETGEVCDFEYGGGRDLIRHDPILIQVIETLGEKANGGCADLRIEEIPSGTAYRIDEYDGIESVETKESYEWTIAP